MSAGRNQQMLEAFKGVVLAKAASSRFPQVSRVLRDIQKIDDAMHEDEIGSNVIQQLISGAQAQQDRKDQQYKSDNSVHKKLDVLIARQDEQALEIAKLKTKK